MYTLSSILARPGWNQKNVDILLGPPDETRPNHGRSRVKLFDGERVMAAEASAHFRRLAQPFRTKSYTVPKGMLLKDNPYIESLENLIIEIIVVPEYKLINGAIGHHNNKNNVEFITTASDERVQIECMISYAKEVLIFYDRRLERQLKAESQGNAIRLLNMTIDRAIFSTYPLLRH